MFYRLFYGSSIALLAVVATQTNAAAQVPKEALERFYEKIERLSRKRFSDPDKPGDALRAPYAVGGFQLGQVVKNLDPTFRCSSSDQFPAFMSCVAVQRTSKGHEEVVTTRSLLHSSDGRVVYVNHDVDPASFTHSEIQQELERLSSKFGPPRLIRRRLDTRDTQGTIAVFGDVQLHEIRAVSTTPSSILVDFLNDPSESFRSGLTVYRVSGGAGFVWIALHARSGKGRLRFFASNASLLTSAGVEDLGKRKQTKPNEGGLASAPAPLKEGTSALPQNEECLPVTPGAGFEHDGIRYVLSTRIFNFGDDVQGLIQREHGPKATIADWVDLKRILSAEMAARFVKEVGIPLQHVNGPCKNYLIAYDGRLKVGGAWYFLARHDGKTPSNWAVIDDIGNQLIDLGRWNYASQALVAVTSRTPNTPIAEPKSETLPERKETQLEPKARNPPAPAAIAVQPRDTNDVVAQVLNYTVFGNDEGTGKSYWYRDQANPCVYRMHTAQVAAGDILGALVDGIARMQPQVVDLNDLDPRSISFRHHAQSGSPGTVTSYENAPMFMAWDQLSLDRLRRGWGLIYSAHCKGKRKAF